MGFRFKSVITRLCEWRELNCSTYFEFIIIIRKEIYT